jgi:peptidyl-tRNA hydrolase
VDRDAVPQWVLPLVVRIERDAPPARSDALAAAARAILLLLTREPPPAQPDDPDEPEADDWAARVRAWEAGRIRKVVRRARGTAWQRVTALPGLTVEVGSAQVRVFPPVPVDAWPPELAKLQVGGTDLDDPRPPDAPGPGVPVLWLNPALPMTAGKAMAQAGHGAQLAWYASGPADRERWAAAGFPLAVRVASAERWPVLLAGAGPVVSDGGFTEVAPGSQTVVADVPWAGHASGA